MTIKSNSSYIFPSLRPHQADVLESIKQSKAKFIVLNAPTGSGKSFFPAQLAFEGSKVLSCVQVKSLQTQYAESYDMAELFGKANYKCLNNTKQLELLGGEQVINAETCTLPRSQYKEECLYRCPYPVDRQAMINSYAGVLNFSKFLLDQGLVEQFGAEYLFLDEAHLLSDVTVGFAGLQFNWKSKEFQKYGRPFASGLPQPIAFIEVQDWLKALALSMDSKKPLDPEKGGSIRSWLWHRRKVLAVQNTLNFMKSDPASWYVESDGDELRVRPLTARFNFRNLFNRADKIVLMSATIDDHTLRELGIEDYEFLTVPNAIPADMRPIVDMQCPKIGHKSSYDDMMSQAKKIADVLNSRPSHHTGLIHVASKNQAYNMASKLKSMTSREIYVPSRFAGTEEVFNEWEAEKDNGKIGIFWQLWEGYDGSKDSINIVAKVPFIDFGDEFSLARFKYDGKAGNSAIASKLVQGLGRIRRGNDEDYGDNKYVGIADGNWIRVMKYINQDIMESIK